MEAPEFLKPEDGYKQLTIPSPFGDGRKTVDIFARHMEDATEYVIFIDEHEMGDLMFDDGWHPIRNCMLTAKEISILTPLIEQSSIKPVESEAMSEAEQTLRLWLNEHSVYPGNKLLQFMVINSFYAEDNEDHDDDSLVELDEENIEALNVDDNYDDHEVDWDEIINYALANQDNFLAYIDANWRDTP